MDLFFLQRSAMSIPPCQWTTLRPYVFSSLLVLCFVTLFFTYSNLEMKFPSFNIFEDRDLQSYPPVLCADSNCSTELHHNHTQDIQVEEVDIEPDTIVLIWMWLFGVRFDAENSTSKNANWLMTRPFTTKPTFMDILTTCQWSHVRGFRNGCGTIWSRLETHL